jgi:DNA-binding NarL/FixJ family response regulator
MILAVMDDLVFRSKLEAVAQQAGTTVVFGSAAPAPPARVLVDLNGGGDPLGTVRALRAAYPSAPIVGYCSHIQQELQRDALAAGCTSVLPRSAFVQQLGKLITESGDA